MKGVNRLHCRGTTYDVELVVDINSELFDVKPGERGTFAFLISLVIIISLVLQPTFQLIQNDGSGHFSHSSFFSFLFFFFDSSLSPRFQCLSPFDVIHSRLSVT